MRLAGVRRQLEEARAALVESAGHAGRGEHDPAYRAALKARNLVFHATRGLAAARGEELPEMPVVGTTVGTLADHEPVLQAIAGALAVEDDAQMGAHLEAGRAAWGRYLGWLRDEVGKALRH